MAVSAALVKKLRDETDAPMMECKAALEEAAGDYEKAKDILREKGRAAAAKRAGRSTSAGVALFVREEGVPGVAGVVLESETDFVSKNEKFVEFAQRIAQAYLRGGPADDPLSVPADGTTIGGLVEQAIATFRENVRLARALKIDTSNPVAFYVHHDRTKAAAVELTGSANNLLEVGKQLAIQCVVFPPAYLRRDLVPPEVVEKEIEIETQRAINEGKNPDVARNIAQGRVNKGFYQQQVLLEQLFYNDQKRTVAQWIADEAKSGGGTIEVLRYENLAVGAGGGEDA